MTVKSLAAIALLLAGAVVLPGCANTQRGKTNGDNASRTAEPAAYSNVTLPTKRFYSHPDGSIELMGHWTLKMQEDQVPGVPLGAQPLNSTNIRCWPTALKRICVEHRAQIAKGTLLPQVPPMEFDIISVAGGGRIIGKWESLDVRMLLHIYADGEDAELEVRRPPSPGYSRVFERWVLE